MKTHRATMPLRKAFLAYTVLATTLQYQCHAFSSNPSQLMVRPLPQHLLPTKTTSAAITETGLCATEEDHEQEDRSRPDIVVINNHKDYVDFLEADDRLCVVK